MPDLPGSIKSRRTRSYWLSSIFRSPSSPVAAVSADMPSEERSSSILSLISSSSSIMRTEPLRLDIHGFPEGRQFQLERAPVSELALDRYIPPVLLHDAITHRESQTRSLTESFRCEERVINFVNVFAADTGSRVLNRYLDFRINSLGANAQLDRKSTRLN